MDSIIYRAAHVTPSDRQLAWQELEFTAFIHYTVNAFTDREWGDGTESPSIFNPTQLDARQWVGACKDAGMRGLILTAKHHDGFCLWPSAYTDHSVKSSPFRDGKGDLVREVADACDELGLKLGLYLSPWDRHEPTYGDSPAYNEHFRNQLTELCTNYGDLYCLWFDGACGEGPNGKRQVYDWNSYYRLIRELQPGACISICGPDVRWCGNEAGHCRPSEWSVVPNHLQDQEKIADKSQQTDDAEFARRVDTQDDDLGSREKVMAADDLIWFPAEVDTSIRPGWFYHAHEDDKVKTVEHLLDVYYSSVGGNAVLLLNLPPDRRGLVHETDVQRLRELGRILRETFDENLAGGANATASEVGAGHRPANALDGDTRTFWRPEEVSETGWLEVDMGRPVTFDRAMVQECIREGQRIEAFRLEAWDDGEWHEFARDTTVGYKQLLRFEPVTAQRVRMVIEESRWCPTVANFGLYKTP